MIFLKIKAINAINLGVVVVFTQKILLFYNKHTGFRGNATAAAAGLCLNGNFYFANPQRETNMK